MTVTLVIPDQLGDSLIGAARHPLETAGVVLARLVEGPDDEVRLLASEILWVPERAYRERHPDRLGIASEGYIPALGEAERRGAMALWLHTHPGEGSTPLPSQYDLEVDRQLRDVFALRTGSGAYGTLIVSPHADGFAFSGTIGREGLDSKRIDRLWRVGESWVLNRGYDSELPMIAPLFDRSVRAFGPDIQGAIGNLKIGVVGCGGTGSAVSEQLVRLGVRDLVLIDNDTLSDTNVTRVYGSTPGLVGRSKVDVAHEHLIAIAPDLRCEVVQSNITYEATARRLLGRDLIFGCTDDNAGRLVLSRFATYMLTPLIDLGVLISSDADGRISGIDGRVTVVAPGSACLVCRDRIDTTRAAAELMSAEEHRRLLAEGYAPALNRTEPAVVSFTTAVAAAGVTELLERLIGFGPTPRPSEVLLRWHEREISTNRAEPRPGHYCAAKSGKWGRGVTTPFLEQVWRQ